MRMRSTFELKIFLVGSRSKRECALDLLSVFPRVEKLRIKIDLKEASLFSFLPMFSLVCRSGLSDC